MADSTHDTLPPLRHQTAAGRRIAYREAGSGPALVLLHGVGSGSGSWRAQFSSLAGKLRIIAWDAPGYGGSDPLPMPSPSPADYAASLLGLMHGLGLARINLLGHSLGALVAASFCRQHPDKVAALILANPTSGYASAPEELRRARIDGRLEDMKALGPAGLAAKRAPGLLSAQASPAMVEAVRAVMASLHPEGYAQAVRMLGQGDILAEVRAISTPTLVIGSSGDTITPEAGNRKIAEAIRGARYASIAGPGHASYVEQPAAFDVLLTDFLGERR